MPNKLEWRYGMRVRHKHRGCELVVVGQWRKDDKTGPTCRPLAALAPQENLDGDDVELIK